MRIFLLLALLPPLGLGVACLPDPGTSDPSGMLPDPGTAGPSGVLYVATAGDMSVVVIDLATMTVVDEISLDPSTPHGLAIDPGGQRLYVANTSPGNTIQVIDTATRQVVGALDVGTRSHHIQLSQDGGELYVAPMGGTRFHIYDLVSGERTTLTVSMGIQDVAVSPDGRTAMVASTGFVSTSVPASVSLIDLLNRKVLATVPLPSTPGLTPATDHAIFSPDGMLGYIVDQGANRLLLLDLSSGTWMGEVVVGRQPHGVAVTRDGQKVYVGNRGADSISVIDARTFTVMATITVGTTPDHLTLDLSGHFLFIPIRSTRVMKVLDVSTDQIVDEIPVGRDLHVSVQGHN